MKLVIQRVLSASVSVDNKVISHIENGLLVFVGLKTNDTENQFDHLIKKVINLRIFADEQNKMNKSILDYNYEVLLVSQFTLYADCEKGNRPSFIAAMNPNDAEKMYAAFVQKFRQMYSKVYDGKFAAHMVINLINDGPVTIILEN